MWQRAQQFFKNNGKKLAVGTGAVVALPFVVADTAFASGNQAHWGHYPWNHTGYFDSFDHASLRRGYQVYKEVCSACHSAEKLHYRKLVGLTHTEAQAREEAAAITVTEYDRVPYLRNHEPDAKGNAWQRPGKLFDHFPSPYPNENAARAANNGALPPDMSLIALARPGGIDYIFALLTGYDKPVPPGVNVPDGKYWNPWFSGGIISMAPPLMDGSVDFEDGTPATLSQCAKDVSTFLHWASEPYLEESKLMAVHWWMGVFMALIAAGYAKRYVWNPWKTQKIVWKVPRQMPSQ